MFLVRMVYIRTKNMVGARSAQGLLTPARTEKPVRADRRLRTDDESIRTQTTILKKPVFPILKRVLRQERLEWEIKTIFLKAWR